jgi:hypothetical protein
MVKETKLEGKRMVTLTKRSKIVIVALTAVALLAVAVPYAVYALPSASDSNIVGVTRTLAAKGVAVHVVNGQNVTVPANFTLTLERAVGSSNTLPRFNVSSGSVVVNGITYTITQGNGGVLRGRHLILLQAQGTGPDGQVITFKFAGRYFWLGGHLYVARIGARLFTEDDNFVLLLRAAIRV